MRPTVKSDIKTLNCGSLLLPAFALLIACSGIPLKADGGGARTL